MRCIVDTVQATTRPGSTLRRFRRQPGCESPSNTARWVARSAASSSLNRRNRGTRALGFQWFRQHGFGFALRHSGAFPGDLVAVQGIGGLGHLGIQFANKFGYKVAAIGRGSENAALAKKLGASVYIDSKATNAAEALQKLGGAQVILATAPSSKAMSELIDGLGPNGRLMVIGAAFDPIEVTPIQLISGSRTIQGWASGTPIDAEDTLRFARTNWCAPPD